MAGNSDAATKCPICGTYYAISNHYVEVECRGEGNCPARKAGPRVSENAVLCACNQRWLENSDVTFGVHSFNDCIPLDS